MQGLNQGLYSILQYERFVFRLVSLLRFSANNLFWTKASPIKSVVPKKLLYCEKLQYMQEKFVGICKTEKPMIWISKIFYGVRIRLQQHTYWNLSYLVRKLCMNASAKPREVHIKWIICFFNFKGIVRQDWIVLYVVTMETLKIDSDLD